MSFRFKRFAVEDDRCAMRVGTDGVLLGAWASAGEGGAPPGEAPVFLDVGTGSGVIALMLAQRAPYATVLAIDIDRESVLQARENTDRSPFAKGVRVFEADLCTFRPDITPHHIVCNPPFHTETLVSSDTRRAHARHAHALTFPALIYHAARLLQPGGLFSLIVPYRAQQEIAALSVENGFRAERITYVRTKAAKMPSRVLSEWRKAGPGCAPDPLRTDTLTLLTDSGSRTPEYATLTACFYL